MGLAELNLHAGVKGCLLFLLRLIVTSLSACWRPRGLTSVLLPWLPSETCWVVRHQHQPSQLCYCRRASPQRDRRGFITSSRSLDLSLSGCFNSSQVLLLPRQPPAPTATCDSWLSRAADEPVNLHSHISDRNTTSLWQLGKLWRGMLCWNSYFFQICLKRGKSFCDTRQSWVEAEEGGMEGVGGILLQLIILTGLLGSGERDKQVFDLRSLNSKVKSSFRHFHRKFHILASHPCGKWQARQPWWKTELTRCPL